MTPREALKALADETHGRGMRRPLATLAWALDVLDLALARPVPLMRDVSDDPRAFTDREPPSLPEKL